MYTYMEGFIKNYREKIDREKVEPKDMFLVNYTHKIMNPYLLSTRRGFIYLLDATLDS